MRSNLMKLLAIVLASVLLTAAIASGVGILFNWEMGLYERTLAEANREQQEAFTYEAAYNAALEFAAKNLGGMEENETWLLENAYVPSYIEEDIRIVSVRFADESGTAESGGEGEAFTYALTVQYPVVLWDGENFSSDQVPLYEVYGQVVRDDGVHDYTLLYYLSPPIEVTVAVAAEDDPAAELEQMLYTLRYHFLLIAVGSLALSVLCMVYLCWAAGKKKGQTGIRPGGLNRLPLDLYAAAVLFLGFWCVWGIFEGAAYLFHENYIWLALVLAGCLVFEGCTLGVCFLFAFAAQVKANGYWWRHSVIGWCLLKVYAGVRWCWRGARAVFSLLPVIWQWLLTAAGMALAVGITATIAYRHSYIRIDGFGALMLFGAVVLCIGIVLYGGYAFGTLLKGAREMAKGDLNRKVDPRYLIGSFRDCAENLNVLADAAVEAARQQTKSERMKTELITNVSHDIKTPLTSIINYVDLLQKPHTEEENGAYLDVLARQSQRLKKLTEDLVEMSKASTGNVAVELGQVDAVEAALQALGEFGDKLDAVPLSVVFPQPEDAVFIRADGRLTWRVMSNLLSNAVKYAQPGTRLYVDIARRGEKVAISFKNVSREQLNVTAEELMERFVRGDASRNTEGSGLGLNIAKGLMEVQGGTLGLTVDGDLFKVMLEFPAD